MVTQVIVIYNYKRRERLLPRTRTNWDYVREMTFTRMFGASYATCCDLLRKKMGYFKEYVLVCKYMD